jgi:hypothetical protein
MNRFAVLLALLLAACATPAPRAPETVPAAPPKAAAPAPEAPVTAPDAPRAAPAAPAIAGVPPAAIFREFVARNDERLLEVFAGMHKSELARIMHADADRWRNPYRREALLDRKGQAYEVFYYLTRDPEGKPVKDRHLTPVIVKQDTVVAIGAYRLKKLKRGESIDLPRRSPKRSS